MKKLTGEFKKFTLYFDSFECVVNEHVTFYADYETAKKIMCTMADEYASHHLFIFAQMYEGRTKIDDYEVDNRR